MSIALHTDTEGLERLRRRVAEMAVADTRPMLGAVGAEVESQTKRRINEEKSGPAGDWPGWSPRYARSRHGGHSLLMGEGDLEDSIQHLVAGDRVEVGSSLVYAAIHQFGGAEAGKPEIPARPYLWLSDENLADLERLVDDWAAGLLEAP